MSDVLKQRLILYSGESGKIRSELFDKEAYIIAKSFTAKNGNISISNSQFRKIFDELKRIKFLLDRKGDWSEVEPLFKLLKSKVAYNVKRNKPKVKKNDENKILLAKCYDNFFDYFDTIIELTKDYTDFKYYVLLTEAVYGYFYSLSKKTE